ncbi:MAG: N-acyl-D-amino-acid deacylase family protein [Acidobacteriaceae bacterium]
MYKYVIKNGTVIDGVAKNAYKHDIAISEGVVVGMGRNIPAKTAEKVIDATGKFVVPGFIDIQNHSDSYWTIFDQPSQVSMVSQGITTIVTGNCGSSLAPLAGRESIKTIQKWHDLSGVNVNWASFEELGQVIEQNRLGVNVASLVGHATLRRGLLGDQVRTVTEEEVKVMERLLTKALDDGAFGLSMGLVYAHEVDSAVTELLSLAKSLQRHNKYLSVHLRSESEGILDAVDEAIDIGQRLEIPVKISHLKLRGKENWHLFDRLINKLENAFHSGLDITFDVYPYSSAWSVLYTYLPKWAYEGGRAETLRRINSEKDRKKILDFLRNQNYDYSNIRVATAEANNAFIGKTILHIAANLGTSNEEALLKVLSSTKNQAIVFDNNLFDEHVELLVSSPLSIIATDGAGYSREGQSLVHPRCFGTMPKLLSMVREQKIMKWERAIAKITSEPARLLGLKRRGRIAIDAFADLVVFDPDKIKDRATFDQPFMFADGIDQVFVNGGLAFENKQPDGLHGIFLKR